MVNRVMFPGKHFLIILLLVMPILTGCGVEQALRVAVEPLQDTFIGWVDDAADILNGLSGDDNDNLIDDITGQLNAVSDTTTGIQSASETIFGNPNFLSLTPTYPLTDTYDTTSVPPTYYPTNPQPVRIIGYRMSQMTQQGSSTMSLVDMAYYLGQAVALPFIMMRALTSTTSVIGPLGLLLTWIALAAQWVLGVQLIGFIVGLIRNAGGVQRMVADILKIFRG